MDYSGKLETDYFAPDVLWMLKEDKGKEHSHRIQNQTEQVKRQL